MPESKEKRKIYNATYRNSRSQEQKAESARKRKAYWDDYYSNVRRARLGIRPAAEYRASIARSSEHRAAQKRIYDDFANIMRILRKYDFCLPNKNFKIFKSLQCSIPEFKAHIQAQFTDGMSWMNYGQKAIWEFDHIKPLASFELSDPAQFSKAAHFSNVRPLLRAKNSKNRIQVLPKNYPASSEGYDLQSGV